MIAGCQTSSSSRFESPGAIVVAVSNKKPAPLFELQPVPRPSCPVCGFISYSREGIHPQCAQRQCDELRIKRAATKRGRTVRKEKTANPLAVKAWHKRCAHCQAQVHIRQLTCTCGHEFKKSR